MELNKETGQWWHRRKCNHWIPNHSCTCGYEAFEALRAENRRLAAELDEARSQWRTFASMMEFEPEDCTCLEPPGVDEENEPSAHSQYCPIYLEAYARAMADGTELPE